MDILPMENRLKKIRSMIENAQPAEEFFAERGAIKKNYKKHLDALLEEHDALTDDDEYMNYNEAVSIRSLVSFVTHSHNIREDIACAIVEEQFGLEEIRKLPRNKYMDVVEYLVDFDPKKIMN